ncbi:MAG: hypothetical protein AAFR17_07010 [Pseudomonadota bacterium]
MAKQIILSHPNWFKLMKSAETISFTAPKFEFGIEFTKHVQKKLDENPVFQQKLWDAASKEWKQMLTNLDNTLDMKEASIALHADRGLTKKELETLKKTKLKEFEEASLKIVKTASVDMESAVMKEWAKIRKQNNLANTFKIKTFFKGVGRVTGMALAVGSLVLSGGTNAIAYMAIVRMIGATVADMKKLTVSLDKLGAELYRDVQKVSDNIDKSAARDNWKAAGDVIATNLFGTDLLKSHSSVMKKLRVYQARIAILQQKHMRLGKKINEAMAEIKKQRAKAGKGLDAKLADVEKKLDILLKKTAAMGHTFTENDQAAARLVTTMVNLKSAKARNITSVAGTATQVAAIVGKMVLAAAVMDAESASSALSDAAGLVVKEAA